MVKNIIKQLQEEVEEESGFYVGQTVYTVRSVYSINTKPEKEKVTSLGYNIDDGVVKVCCNGYQCKHVFATKDEAELYAKQINIKNAKDDVEIEKRKLTKVKEDLAQARSVLNKILQSL